MKARKRMVGAMAAACWLLLTLVAGAESVPLFARRKPWKLGGGDQRGDPSLEDVVNHQDVLAESCSSTRHAEACPDGTVMIFARTMLGSCSPVGCIEPSGEDAFIHKGHEAASRRTIVKQTAGQLDADEHGDVVKKHFSLAMAYGQPSVPGRSDHGRFSFDEAADGTRTTPGELFNLLWCWFSDDMMMAEWLDRLQSRCFFWCTVVRFYEIEEPRKARKPGVWAAGVVVVSVKVYTKYS